MRHRVIAALAAVLLLGAANLSPVQKANPNDAPGDKYFGRLKMSALSIRYHIQRWRARLNMTPSDAQNVLHETRFADEAFVQWQSSYPKDAWLAQTAYALAELYAAIPDPAAHERALRIYADTGKRYATTKYGHLSRLAFKNGAPMPATANAATPNPSATPVADGTAAPATAASAPPVAAPSATTIPGVSAPTSAPRTAPSASAAPAASAGIDAAGRGH